MTTIYCDGGCNGNGTIGATTYGSFSVNGTVHRVVLEGRTNNEAEYMTLIEALQYCDDHNIHAPEIFMDSQLVVSQVAGTWKVRAANLRSLQDKAKQLYGKVYARLSWVPRDQIVAQLGH